MHNHLFRGNLVRLSTENPEVYAEAFTRWGRDSEFLRMLDNDPARPWSFKKRKEWAEKELDDPDQAHAFTIRTLTDDQLIGFVGLWEINWTSGNGWVGIGLGERDFWSRGFGSDAMRLILQYAFTELNLHCVSLGVFAYNKRALRAYEKAGFKIEGIARQSLLREGQRWDIAIMGILQNEWKTQVSSA